MATIKPIEGRSVHQIQSGQVIVDLNSVCKELVENSLDAGATSIEIRFKNNGLDAIEVQDNGSGISPEDYDTIALKHYTSKLSTYDDLSSLNTFGFRGEALSSLCALSKFHIITARASDGAKGTKLEFEQSGKLKGTSVVAAKQGSTVVVESLFHNLPVRRKELEKSIKREYNKVMQLLHAYACISVGVKFSVSNQMPKGKKTVAFSTNTNPNTKENIANVYGAKTLLALVRLDLKFEMTPSTRSSATQIAPTQNTQEDIGSKTVQIVGHISRPVVGEGRQTPDRQMFFVNSRPCTLPQVAKAFNEVYRTYNVTQSAFIFADIKLDTNAYDVNVSPDKRTIMLHDQTTLLGNLKEALVELFDSHDQSVPQSQLMVKRTPSLAASKQSNVQQQDGVESDEDEEPPVQISNMRKPSSSLVERSGPSLSTEARPRTDFIKASLIERFAERDAGERPVQRKPPQGNRSASEKEDLAEEVPVHSSSKARSTSSEESPVRQTLDRGSESPLFEPQRDISPVPGHSEQTPQAVKNSNTRIASLRAESVAHSGTAQSTDSDDEDEDEQESVAVIKQTPQKNLSQSTIQNAFDRMRPMRTPTQQATITVGNTTTVSTIGNSGESRAAKRARIHTPKFGLNGTPLSQKPKHPLFMKSLRGFAAPGTQLGDSDDEDEDIESSMPVGSVRSPSPVKKSRTREFEGPRTDDLAESSSAHAPQEVPPHKSGSSGVGEIEDESSDGEFIDEDEKKAREEARIAQSIAEAEEAAARPTEVNLKRADKLSKISHVKYQTMHLERAVETKISSIEKHIHNLATALEGAGSKNASDSGSDSFPLGTQLQQENAEERLSLTVSKSDFDAMRIIGQFNLGFILTVRPPTSTSPSSELFIIDQHASDEKYNFERLSATTVLDPQRMVHPHPLELTAVEEEIILNHEASLVANGFHVDIDTSGDKPVGRRAALTSLPMSKEVTFTPKDLEELLALILDNPPPVSASTPPSSTPSLFPPNPNPRTNRHSYPSQSAAAAAIPTYTPRPSKVRKLLASRACRSSVMIGKTLKMTQMQNIVQHMGSMDKPWSCPHGRPTMRHMFGLDKWDTWSEGDGLSGLGEVGLTMDWGGWARTRRAMEEQEEMEEAE